LKDIAKTPPLLISFLCSLQIPFLYYLFRAVSGPFFRRNGTLKPDPGPCFLLVFPVYWNKKEGGTGMGYIAVIDTETNWADQVMSIGTVIADRELLRPVAGIYQVLTPEYQVGGMFSDTLFLPGEPAPEPQSRDQALMQLKSRLELAGVEALYAYNAGFDRNHLPELGSYRWFDIMRMAAYRQFNPAIPADAPCCSTGRMKRGYGVEPMLRLLRGCGSYSETHNALRDALDELEIMRLLAIHPEQYIPL